LETEETVYVTLNLFNRNLAPTRRAAADGDPWIATSSGGFESLTTRRGSIDTPDIDILRRKK
jgi:hypothetical protein